MSKTYLKAIIVLVVILPAISRAQTYQKTAAGVKATIKDIEVQVQFYSPQIVWVIKTPVKGLFTKESLSVIKKPEQTQLSISNKGDALVLIVVNSK